MVSRWGDFWEHLGRGQIILDKSFGNQINGRVFPTISEILEREKCQETGKDRGENGS